MNYVDPPAKLPLNISHNTYYSQTLKRETGYCIYLPPDYGQNNKRYPVVYHIHGWKGDESSETRALEEAYRSRQAITVFVNAISGHSDYRDALAQIEKTIVYELAPYIEGRYDTYENRAGRTLSGFSMGGAMAFYYAVKNNGTFGAVIPYAGTFHHLYHAGYNGVGEPREKAAELYAAMLEEKRDRDEGNILCLVSRAADKIRGELKIDIRVGADDILICDNEILHLHLNSLEIPHGYEVIGGADHNLEKICA